MAADPSRRDAALAFLDEHRVMTLATQDGAGPWAAAVFYAPRGFDLLFLSSTASRHGRQLASDPRAAVTIQDQHRDWSDIRGLQMEGSVEQLDGAARQAALELYLKRFPFLSDAALAGAVAAALERVSCYCFLPRAVWFVDNGVAFGHRDAILP